MSDPGGTLAGQREALHALASPSGLSPPRQHVPLGCPDPSGTALPGHPRPGGRGARAGGRNAWVLALHRYRRGRPLFVLTRWAPGHPFHPRRGRPVRTIALGNERRPVLQTRGPCAPRLDAVTGSGAGPRSIAGGGRDLRSVDVRNHATPVRSVPAEPGSDPRAAPSGTPARDVRPLGAHARPSHGGG